MSLTIITTLKLEFIFNVSGKPQQKLSENFNINTKVCIMNNISFKFYQIKDLKEGPLTQFLKTKGNHFISILLSLVYYSSKN